MHYSEVGRLHGYFGAAGCSSTRNLPQALASFRFLCGIQNETDPAVYTRV